MLRLELARAAMISVLEKQQYRHRRSVPYLLGSLSEENLSKAF